MGDWVSFGGGSSSSSGQSATQVQLTPEQQAYLKAQTDAFTGTFLPAYQSAIKGAGDVYSASSPYLNKAALQGFNQSSGLSNSLLNPSTQAIGTSADTLANIISPDYINSQIQGYLQPVMEQNREANNSLFAQYGGSGNLGSSRAALAESSLGGLNQARLQAAGTNALANITGQQIGAAGTLGGLGFQGIGAAQGANQAALGYANAPSDLYAKYASVLYGVPQQSTTPNFSNTQGSTSQGGSASNSTRWGF